MRGRVKVLHLIKYIKDHPFPNEIVVTVWGLEYDPVFPATTIQCPRSTPKDRCYQNISQWIWVSPIRMSPSVPQSRPAVQVNMSSCPVLLSRHWHLSPPVSGAQGHEPFISQAGEHGFFSLDKISNFTALSRAPIQLEPKALLWWRREAFPDPNTGDMGPATPASKIQWPHKQQGAEKQKIQEDQSQPVGMDSRI